MILSFARQIPPLLLFLLISQPVIAADIPAGFVSLAELDNTIFIEMRYAGSFNFTGKPVPGYAANKCYLMREAAEALHRVQLQLRQRNLSLKLYDCYRPQMAVDAFMRWANDVSEQSMQRSFYPHIAKADLVKLGYIAKRSGHSRGDSIDVTITALPVAAQPAVDIVAQQSCTADHALRYGDNSLDMGSGYDCFDTLSNTEDPRVGDAQMKNRLLLREVLEKAGFKNYKKEWWHFTYKGKTGKKSFHNFVIE
ncbi:MAG: M15 family metallopeptidase [Gammaproteobacteria bacterium]|nr:M15 family metallopeptidase [Gammaproteobacteria bacterium]MDH5651955.1 M15 family metallopeptidase [Gammaproteobacteria bacterium]